MHLRGFTVEANPCFKGALTRLVIQRLLHRNALHVNFAAIVALFHHARAISGHISRLNRIPAQTSPVRVRLFTIRRERIWPGVKRHLNLPPPVVAIDEILSARKLQISNGTAEVKIHTDFDGAVIQIADVVLHHIVQVLRVLRTGI